MKQNIPTPTNAFARRVHTPLPSYRYVPGILPHPLRHPQGHLYHGGPVFEEGACWEEDERFLFGADLFDARFFWESHENWEHCWHRAKGQHKICIQGLIQVSASILKHHMKSWKPRDTLFSNACRKLAHSDAVQWDFTQLLHDTQLFFEGGNWPLLGREFPRK